ncbi:PREDICTED: uncharacterized protein LOC104704755 [Camelina sativa]|uniref:Uncharacterized protein LOC104704755 n=1 Tax=Camelina sativa TaxID=90675 RepID=A0ABM0T0U0_CAMSA|nr:PREDICTED: uncharacterized protein LOC104704755 [Camelina sativa]
MEKSLGYVALPKPLKFDPECFGYWKVMVKQVISSIDMEAWFAVEDGWSPPMEKDEEGELVPKHRKKCTAEEKAESKHNSQALSVIFNVLPRGIFSQVHGCVFAKEAWDILVVTFEGTSSIKRTRLDNLASDFENLHMTENESVADYNIRLSGIAQEAVVLGKHYKDKKLVKKFLRSLPDKFQPHRSAIDVSLNSDELKFNQVVGMMQAFELQLKKKEKLNENSFALKAVEEQKAVESQEAVDEEKVGLLVKKFFRKMERGQRKGPTSFGKTDANKDFRKGDKHDRQCAECEGYRHYRSECPNNKRKNSLQCYGCKGYGHIKTDCPSRENKHKLYITWSESDSEEEEGKGNILNNFVALLGVIEENEDDEILMVEEGGKREADSDSDGEEADLSVEDQIELLIKTVLQKTKDNTDLLSERDTLQMNISMLSKELDEEKAKSLRLEKQLEEQLKNIRMLNQGTKNLDTLLSNGRSNNVKWGLGYQGADAKGNHRDSCMPPPIFNGPLRDLFDLAEEHDVEADQAKWYFDSGCSRHMTGASDNLSHGEDVVGGKVTFRDGGKGTIRGKGMTCGESQPHLKYVFLVDGLKANLISVSQLCDEGLDVTLPKKDCRAVDQQGSVKLRGRRSGNNCYMWNSENQCFNASAKLDTDL